MTYGVIVGTKVSYNVEVEAESFNQAAEKALDYARNTEDIEGQICEATRQVVPEGILNDAHTTVEIICVHRP